MPAASMLPGIGGTLTGAQMKALANQQQAQMNALADQVISGNVDLRAMRDRLANHADALRNASAEFAMHNYRSGLMNVYATPDRTPESEPKGPPDVWHWLAYLEDTGQLRWWHLVRAWWSEFRPLSGRASMP